MGVRAVAIDSASPDRLYAGTWDGVFVSDDGGASWEAVPGFDGAVIVLHVTSDGERLLVETESGIIVLDLGALA